MGTRQWQINVGYGSIFSSAKVMRRAAGHIIMIVNTFMLELECIVRGENRFVPQRENCFVQISLTFIRVKMGEFQQIQYLSLLQHTDGGTGEILPYLQILGKKHPL